MMMPFGQHVQDIQTEVPAKREGPQASGRPCPVGEQVLCPVVLQCLGGGEGMNIFGTP